ESRNPGSLTASENAVSITANEKRASGKRSISNVKSSVSEQATSPVAYRDLREWLQGAAELGELKTIRNVHWDREMGAMVEMCYRRRGSKTAALLFDDVPGYPGGHRCLYGMMCS